MSSADGALQEAENPGQNSGFPGQRDALTVSGTIQGIPGRLVTMNEVRSSHDQVVHLSVLPIEQELRNPPAVWYGPSRSRRTLLDIYISYDGAEY